NLPALSRSAKPCTNASAASVPFGSTTAWPALALAGAGADAGAAGGVGAGTAAGLCDAADWFAGVGLCSEQALAINRTAAAIDLFIRFSSLGTGFTELRSFRNYNRRPKGEFHGR